jgi:hypothetical protein
VNSNQCPMCRTLWFDMAKRDLVDLGILGRALRLLRRAVRRSSEHGTVWARCISRSD